MPARIDRTQDPAIARDLLSARRGTAFFARKLNELSDVQLSEDSLLPGWSRKHLVAHVGYNARAISRLVSWAGTGVETPMYTSPDQRAEEIDLGATLPPLALRNLVDHAAIHLSVEWRDLPAEDWANLVTTAQGRVVPVSETPWMRTGEVWIHAVDLNNGASFDDIPSEVGQRLLSDILGMWTTRESAQDLRIEVDGQTRLHSGDGSVLVSGDLAAVVAWASGRGASLGPAQQRLHTNGSQLPTPPRWL